MAFIKHRDGQTWLRPIEVHLKADRIVAPPWGPGGENVSLPLSELTVLHKAISFRVRGMY